MNDPEAVAAGMRHSLQFSPNQTPEKGYIGDTNKGLTLTIENIHMVRNIIISQLLGRRRHTCHSQC